MHGLWPLANAVQKYKFELQRLVRSASTMKMWRRFTLLLTSWKEDHDDKIDYQKLSFAFVLRYESLMSLGRNIPHTKGMTSTVLQVQPIKDVDTSLGIMHPRRSWCIQVLFLSASLAFLA